MHSVFSHYASEGTTSPTSKKLLTAIVDFCINPDGKPTIYEFQEFAQSSNPSELSKLSKRKVDKNTAKILKDLGIDEDYEQYDLESIGLDKSLQRSSLAAAGCEDLQPKFTILDGDKIDSEESYEQISAFLSKNPSIEQFVIKGALGTRGEANNFLSREELLARIEARNLGQLQITHKDPLLGFRPSSIGESGCQLVLEEFRNPSLKKDQAAVTFRACIAFDPEKPEELRAKMMCAYIHNSSSSHDYKINGSRIDFVDGRHYFFRDGGIDSIRYLSENPAYKGLEMISDELMGDFLRATRAIFRNINKELSETKTIAVEAKPKYYNQYIYPATLHHLMNFSLDLQDDDDLIRRVCEVENLYKPGVMLPNFQYKS